MHHVSPEACVNRSIEPRFVVGVDCYCFCWYTEALAEGDVITDCFGVLVNVVYSSICVYKVAE